MYLFFDTETTGLPQNYKASWNDVNNWPRMTQLGWQLYDSEGQLITEFQSLIKPDGWEVPKLKFFIDNNMSTERCLAEGIPVYDALRGFQEALKQCSLKIAHNINFDNPIIGAEMIRAGITHQLFQYKKGFCTMRSTTKLVGIKKNHGGGNKWPKLIELHEFLFGEQFDGAHDALEDVRATARSFFELKKRGDITLNI